MLVGVLHWLSFSAKLPCNLFFQYLLHGESDDDFAFSSEEGVDFGEDVAGAVASGGQPLERLKVIAAIDDAGVY